MGGSYRTSWERKAWALLVWPRRPAPLVPTRDRASCVGAPCGLWTDPVSCECVVCGSSRLLDKIGVSMHLAALGVDMTSPQLNSQEPSRRHDVTSEHGSRHDRRAHIRSQLLLDPDVSTPPAPHPHPSLKTRSGKMLLGMTDDRINRFGPIIGRLLTTGAGEGVRPPTA